MAAEQTIAGNRATYSKWKRWFGWRGLLWLVCLSQIFQVAFNLHLAWSDFPAILERWLSDPHIWNPNAKTAVGGIIMIVGCLIYDRRRMKQERREEQGLCLKCGYDLRETPQRCPECGATPLEHQISSVCGFTKLPHDD